MMSPAGSAADIFLADLFSFLPPVAAYFLGAPGGFEFGKGI
jgi:hypothetical protein